MYLQCKRQMVNISTYAGARKDYVQGGGGNTSVKLDDRLMIIKASGYTLQEVTEKKGYVAVDYRNITRYFESVDTREERDYEKESLTVNLENVVLFPGMENVRPSVEVGFHSCLKKCGIHTHSVYANLLCCSEERRELTGSILAGSGIRYVFVPYLTPGFYLTLAVKKAIKEYKAQNGAAPDVIFLENHGMIVHGEDDERAIFVHETVNDRIRHYFDLPEYPDPRIRETEGGFASDTEFVKSFCAEMGEDFFNRLRIYPDQLVYIGSKAGDTVRMDGGQVYYHTGKKEAQTVEEVLLGVAYVVGNIRRLGLHLTQMDEAAADFISNWESEKYRQKMIK